MTAKETRKIIEEKVTGVWVPQHDEFGHHYLNTKTGALVDSVTTKNIIDKPHLVPWAVGLAIDFLEKHDNFSLLQTEARDDIIRAAKLQSKDVMNDAGNVGSIAHDAIEEYVNVWIDSGKQPDDIRFFLKEDDDYRSWASARAAEDIFRKYKVSPVATEFVVGKDEWGAGTLDMLVINEHGELEMWDWKTSNQIDDFYACQISAYVRMFEYMTGLKIARARIFKLDKKTNRHKTYEVCDIEESFEIFLGCSKVHDWKYSKTPKLKEVKKTLTL